MARHSGKTIYFPPKMLKKLMQQGKAENRKLSPLVVRLLAGILK